MQTLAEAQEELYHLLSSFLDQEKLVYDYDSEALTEFVNNHVDWEVGEVDKG